MKLSIAILTPLLLITTVSTIFAYNITDLKWYEKEFDKVGVYNNLDKDYVSEQVNNLFSYLNGKERLDQKYYTETEMLHLKDIKMLLLRFNIFRGIIFLMLLVFLLFIYIKNDAVRFLKIIFYSSLLSLLILAAISSVFIFVFDNLFLIFHQILFANDFWQLDPDTENLINIFPPELFYDRIRMTFVICFGMFISALIITYTLFKAFKNLKS